MGAKHVEPVEFNDHHAFTRQELEEVVRAFQRYKTHHRNTLDITIDNTDNDNTTAGGAESYPNSTAAILVVTEKDYMRNTQLMQDVLSTCGALVMRCSLRLDEEAALDTIVMRALQCGQDLPR
jgi:tetraacyldisaccharide-1-P 4'-kinase